MGAINPIWLQTYTFVEANGSPTLFRHDNDPRISMLLPAHNQPQSNTV